MRCDLTRPRPLCAEDEYAFTALQGEASRRRVGSFGTTRRLRRIQVRLVRCLQDVSFLTALRVSPALRCELGYGIRAAGGTPCLWVRHERGPIGCRVRFAQIGRSS